MAVAKTLAYYNAATIKARAANIRLDWKGLPMANTLAYYHMATITGVKYFHFKAP
jgi:hypothetical protein